MPALFCLLAGGAAVSQAQAPPAPHSAPPKYVVLLDPAHGGSDSGATFKNGAQEKTLTLAFALKLRSQLGSRGVQVILTHENDSTQDPNQRAENANRAQAQACLSLHFTETGSGVHLFTSNLEQSPANHFLPWKTAQSGWVNRSLALTAQLNAAFQQAQLPVTLSRWALPGIDSMACPAVAVEIAPERVPGKAQLLSAVDDPKYQGRVADAIAAALLSWRGEAQKP